MARHRARRPRLLALRLALVVIAVAAGVVAAVMPAGSSAATPGTAFRVPAPPVVVSAVPPAGAPLPVAVHLPAVGLDGAVVPVALDSTGSLAPPDDTSRAGWFAQGPAPGQIGPAVLAGHIDSWRGPGVFFALARARPGETVVIDRADGSTLHFTITRVARYPKSGFPTAEVYGPTTAPELRLITCGGDFDRSARSYVDNVVVYARLA